MYIILYLPIETCLCVFTTPLTLLNVTFEPSLDRIGKLGTYRNNEGVLELLFFGTAAIYLFTYLSIRTISVYMLLQAPSNFEIYDRNLKQNRIRMYYVHTRPRRQSASVIYSNEGTALNFKPQRIHFHAFIYARQDYLPKNLIILLRGGIST